MRPPRPWRPGRDRRAVRHPAPAPVAIPPTDAPRRVVVVGGGIAGLAAAVGLAERGVRVTLLEREAQLGGRVASWPVDVPGSGTPQSMSRGFHAFFRQYYNLRALLRRVDPALSVLRGVPDYPLTLAGGHDDSFAGVPRTPPLNLAAFVARSPSFTARDLFRVDLDAALSLLDVSFPETFEAYDGVSAAAFLDTLRFPPGARHLALEVFARSFFAPPEEFSAGELVGMFHTYFVGSAEGLLFDCATDAFTPLLWDPLGAHVERLGGSVRMCTSVASLAESPGGGISVATQGGPDLAADAVVLATDQGGLQRIVAASPWLGDEGWRARVAARRPAPPFAVWRLWFDTPVAPGTAPFLGTSNHGPLDNVSAFELLEDGAAAWARQTGGSVVELHAYALPRGYDPNRDEGGLRARLRAELDALHPELAGAGIVHEEWLVREDCPLVGTQPWRERLTVRTPDPRVVLAGDGLRCDLPVALMERAATTGWQAANALSAGWGCGGHDLWSVPMRDRHGDLSRVRTALRTPARVLGL